MQNSAGNENRTGEAVKQTHGNISQSSKVLMMVAGGLLVVTSGLTYPEWLIRIIQFVIRCPARHCRGNGGQSDCRERFRRVFGTEEAG